MIKTDYDVVIIGGGLAGLINAILLSRSRKKVLVIEKKSYPFHKVCGEYISNEALYFLQAIGFNPFDYGASKINRLRVSSPNGKNIYSDLDLGGFGLSRYAMDEALSKIAIKNGSEILTSTKVSECYYEQNNFTVKTNTGNTFTAKLVIGSYGKRDLLDKKLNRDFMNTPTGYMGVKYHAKTDYPLNEIGLDNFENGYCGIVKIEDHNFNICYLYKRQRNFNFQNIRQLEENVLFKNPQLKSVFSNASFENPTPEVINEISFAPKKLIENHIIMCGDTAGLIAPLCGNGMSMAIHAAKILSELILSSGVLNQSVICLNDRTALEERYTGLWKKTFNSRLFWGRSLQSVFGNPVLIGLTLNMIHAIPTFEKWLIKKTHGKIIA